MKIPVSFRTSYARADKQILVDSGATDNFIDPRLLKRLGLRSLRLERPRKIWNIDGTNNRAGMISDYVDLNVQSGNKGTKMRFLVTDLGLEDLILGYPWLAYFEPKFSWKEGVIDTTHLPIIIRSLSWHQTTQTIVSNATVARIVTDPQRPRERSNRPGTGKRILLWTRNGNTICARRATIHSNGGNPIRIPKTCKGIR
jgi:hypothetical protein